MSNHFQDLVDDPAKGDPNPQELINKLAVTIIESLPGPTPRLVRELTKTPVDLTRSPGEDAFELVTYELSPVDGFAIAALVIAHATKLPHEKAVNLSLVMHRHYLEQSSD